MNSMEPINDKFLKRKQQRWELLVTQLFIDVMMEHMHPPRPFTTDALYDKIDKSAELQAIPIFYLNQNLGNFLKSYCLANRLTKLRSYRTSTRTHRPLVEYVPVSQFGQ